VLRSTIFFRALWGSGEEIDASVASLLLILKKFDDTGISPFAIAISLILFDLFDKPSAPLIHCRSFNTNKDKK
jgi:hypothetical protein